MIRCDVPSQPAPAATTKGPPRRPRQRRRTVTRGEPRQPNGRRGRVDRAVGAGSSASTAEDAQAAGVSRQRAHAIARAAAARQPARTRIARLRRLAAAAGEDPVDWLGDAARCRGVWGDLYPEVTSDQSCCPRHRSRIHRTRLRHRFPSPRGSGRSTTTTRAAVPIGIARRWVATTTGRGTLRSRSFHHRRDALTFAGWPADWHGCCPAEAQSPTEPAALPGCPGLTAGSTPSTATTAVRRGPGPSRAASGPVRARRHTAHGSCEERRGGLGRPTGGPRRTSPTAGRGLISLASDAHASRRLAITLRDSGCAIERPAARSAAAIAGKGCHLLPRPARAGSRPPQRSSDSPPCRARRSETPEPGACVCVR